MPQGEGERFPINDYLSTAQPKKESWGDWLTRKGGSPERRRARAEKQKTKELIHLKEQGSAENLLQSAYSELRIPKRDDFDFVQYFMQKLKVDELELYKILRDCRGKLAAVFGVAIYHDQHKIDKHETKPDKGEPDSLKIGNEEIDHATLAKILAVRKETFILMQYEHFADLDESEKGDDQFWQTMLFYKVFVEDFLKDFDDEVINEYRERAKGGWNIGGEFIRVLHLVQQGSQYTYLLPYLLMGLDTSVRVRDEEYLIPLHEARLDDGTEVLPDKFGLLDSEKDFKNRGKLFDPFFSEIYTWLAVGCKKCVRCGIYGQVAKATWEQIEATLLAGKNYVQKYGSLIHYIWYDHPDLASMDNKTMETLEKTAKFKKQDDVLKKFWGAGFISAEGILGCDHPKDIQDTPENILREIQKYKLLLANKINYFIMSFESGCVDTLKFFGKKHLYQMNSQDRETFFDKAWIRLGAMLKLAAITEEQAREEKVNLNEKFYTERLPTCKHQSEFYLSALRSNKQTLPDAVTDPPTWVIPNFLAGVPNGKDKSLPDLAESHQKESKVLLEKQIPYQCLLGGAPAVSFSRLYDTKTGDFYATEEEFYEEIKNIIQDLRRNTFVFIYGNARYKKKLYCVEDFFDEAKFEKMKKGKLSSRNLLETNAEMNNRNEGYNDIREEG